MKTMKIAGVVSSAHADGNSATLLREALAGAREAGAQTEEIFLPQFTIGYCNGCMACMREGSCGQRDDFEEVRARLVAADGIIMSTPVYAAAPCARMKALIDRLGMFEYMTSATYGGKYVAAIATAKSFGADKTAAYLVNVARGGIFAPAYVSGTLAATIRGGTTAAQCPAYLRKARLLGVKMYHDFRHHKRIELQSMLQRLITAVVMKPLIAKGITAYRDSDLRGVYNNLKGRGLIA